MSEPEPIDEAMVAAALGGYLRAAPAHDLPPRLRRLRTFTPAGLRRHHDEILALLDDETARALVAQWLDQGRPALAKGHAEALRRACDAGDSWRDLVPAAGGSDGEETAARGPEPVDEDKLRKARQEARKAKQQAREAVAQERAQAESLAAQVQSLRAELAQTQESIEDARRALAESQEKHQRAQRRWERKLERAAAEKEAAERDATDLRREARALRAEVRGLTRELADARARPARRPEPARRGAATPAARTPLPVPAGRLDDDPETLASWLRTRGVHLLVDGYNVTLAEGGFGDLDLAAQRDRLVQSIDALARRHRFHATVVFDGAEVSPGTRRPRRGPVTVAYSRPDEIADDHLVVLLKGLPPAPVVVATNDHELQERARELGATIATSTQLLALVR